MTESENSDVAGLLNTAFESFDSSNDLDQVDEKFAPDYVRHSGARDYDLVGFKGILESLREGFPDLKTTIIDVVSEGDRVAYRWEAVGTHTGVYLGFPATGRVITARGITISRIVDGRIAEDWASWNELSLLNDLGILPIDR